MKHSKSSNNLTIILGIATVCLSMALIKEKTENTNIIENKNISIEYKQVNKDTYDLFIRTKGDTNFQTQKNITETINYGSLYLTGSTKTYEREVWEGASKLYGTEWTWNK